MKKQKTIAAALLFTVLGTGVMFPMTPTAAAATSSKTKTTAAVQKNSNSTAYKASLKKKLAPLVTKKTITQTQANKIIAYLVKNPLKSGSNGKVSTNPLAALVKNKTLTQKQANAVVKVLLPVKKTGPSQTGAQDRTAQMKSNLAALVTAGTITQAQADKIIEILTKNQPQAPSGQQGGTPPQQGTEQQPPSGDQPKSPLAGLVTNGTLTQAQADAVAKVLFQGGPGQGGPGQGQPPTQSQSTSSN